MCSDTFPLSTTGMLTPRGPCVLQDLARHRGNLPISEKLMLGALPHNKNRICQAIMAFFFLLHEPLADHKKPCRKMMERHIGGFFYQRIMHFINQWGWIRAKPEEHLRSTLPSWRETLRAVTSRASLTGVPLALDVSSEGFCCGTNQLETPWVLTG